MNQKPRWPIRPPKYRDLVILALLVLVGFVSLGLTLASADSEKSVSLGFKILEFCVQMVLLTVVGGVLVQAYIKWHSRESALNEFRKAMADAVIREYVATKKVRRLLRAGCTKDANRNDPLPWTDLPLETYRAQMAIVNEIQLALEIVKQKFSNSGEVFTNCKELYELATKMEQYLGKIVTEYERHKNLENKQPNISLSELGSLSGFIQQKRDKASPFDEFIRPYKDLLRVLSTEGIRVAV